MSENNTVIGKGGKETTSSKPADNSYAPKSKAPGKSAPSKSSATASKPEAPKATPKTELDLLLEEKYPMPDVIPLLEIVSNWTNVPKRAYPAEVFAKETVAFQLVVKWSSDRVEQCCARYTSDSDFLSEWADPGW